VAVLLFVLVAVARGRAPKAEGGDGAPMPKRSKGALVATVGLGAVVLALAALVGVPLLALALVWGLQVGLDGVLWLALALSTGANLWQIAEAGGRALASSLVTPQAIGGTSGLVILGALALVGLRRLFEGKKESP